MADYNKKRKLIILTGPTAVGKSALSIELAKRIDGEIVSADSMQVYKYMDIGSAKIREADMCGIPHHLINILMPWEEFHVARFKQLAAQALEGIYERGHIPVIVGGTGFYIHALPQGGGEPESAPEGAGGSDAGACVRSPDQEHR